MVRWGRKETLTQIRLLDGRTDGPLEKLRSIQIRYAILCILAKMVISLPNSYFATITPNNAQQNFKTLND